MMLGSLNYVHRKIDRLCILTYYKKEVMSNVLSNIIFLDRTVLL